MIQSISDADIIRQSGDAVGIEEVADNELLQLLTGDLAIAVLVDDLDVGGDVSGGGLEALVHGAVAVHQPLRHLDRLANAVSVPVVRLDDLPASPKHYLARLRHSSRVKSPPF
jgi:hypothetical protein